MNAPRPFVNPPRPRMNSPRPRVTLPPSGRPGREDDVLCDGDGAGGADGVDERSARGGICRGHRLHRKQAASSRRLDPQGVPLRAGVMVMSRSVMGSLTVV
eukprot:9132070-Pyramimonas_sp.AAC.1